MSLSFYFDQHVPRPVASGPRRGGIDVVTAEADDRKGLDDELLLERATTLGRIMVSNDRDFLVITARWMRNGRHFAGLAFLTSQDIPYRKMIEDLMLVGEAYGAEEMVDHVEYLPL